MLISDKNPPFIYNTRAKLLKIPLSAYQVLLLINLSANQKQKEPLKSCLLMTW